MTGSSHSSSPTPTPTPSPSSSSACPPGSSLASLFAECARVAAGSPGRSGESTPAAGSEAVGALASVARRRGSLPMGGAAKMLVTLDGVRRGTVGGGCLEAEITERALAVAASRRPAVSEHTLTSELAGDYGLTCGGTVVMFIEPVFPDPILAAVYTACAELSAGGGRAAMATSADWGAGAGAIAKVLVQGERVVGSTLPALEAVARALPSDAEFPHLEGDVLVEPIAPLPQLLVFGGGHVGRCVAEVAAIAGWRVTVADDRPAFADPARFPFAHVIECDFRELPAGLAIDDATYVVVCTRGHQHDAIVVDQVARGPARYLGMLGSRRKVALTWRLLERWGVAPEALARVHAPVGLAIGADTPEEIAVSIVAEMIAVRRAGSKRRGGGNPNASGASARRQADSAGR